MSEHNTISGLTYEEAAPRVSEWRRFRRVFFGRGVVVFGLVIILVLIITAAFAPWIAPYEPNKTDVSSQLARPSWEHWAGADVAGRDTLSRLIYGARISLMVATLVVTLSAGIGMFLGLLAGYLGGVAYAIIMRFMDTLMAVPMLLLAITIAAVLGGGLSNVIIALGVGLVPTYARLMCGQALSVKENDYILAERAAGASNWRIMLRHVFPNCLPPLMVMMSMQVGTAILAEAGLSFLGIGASPPTATWGNMVNGGYPYLLSNPELSFAPGIAIMLVVFSFNMVGDGLRDALDPRLRGLL